MSAVDFVWMRKFRAYRLGKSGKLHTAPESLQRFKDKIRKLTRHNQGREFEEVIRKVNRVICKAGSPTSNTDWEQASGRGWMNGYAINCDVTASSNATVQSELPAFFKVWAYQNGARGCLPYRVRAGGDCRWRGKVPEQ